MATDKHKTTTAIVAGVTALALVLGGTFAWTSISQQAKNEAAGIVNVGGRLHDDFNGTNKDVYVENFTDPLNGGQPIYARIKLTEYMEVGQDAGGNGTDVNNDGRVVAEPVISGSEYGNVDTWKTFIPGSVTGNAITCKDCDEGNDACTIHEHWKWSVGGSTIFMPTFNKNKDSLTADINGTYHGTDETDKIYYDDYVVYTTDSTTGATDVDFDNKETVDGSIYSVGGLAYYDDDTDTEDNNGTRQEQETHVAKGTASAAVILMEDWDGNPGNFWVYDTDGWAYWANPIMPGESTGLLLDGIEMYKNPGEKCYYSINVIGQFSTINDWDLFYTDTNTQTPDISEDAKKVLTAASQNVPTMTVSTQDGETQYTVGEYVEFIPTIYKNGVAVDDPGQITWEVIGATHSDTRFIGNALYVRPEEPDGVITVVARSSNYPGVVGSKSINVYAKPTFTLYLDGEEVTAEGSYFAMDYSADDIGKTKKLTYTLTGGKPGVWDNATPSFDMVIRSDANRWLTLSDYDYIETKIDSSTGEIYFGNDMQVGLSHRFDVTLTASDGSTVTSPELRLLQDSVWIGDYSLGEMIGANYASWKVEGFYYVSGIKNSYQLYITHDSYGADTMKYYVLRTDYVPSDFNTTQIGISEAYTEIKPVAYTHTNASGESLTELVWVVVPGYEDTVFDENTTITGYMAGADDILGSRIGDDIGSDDVEVTLVQYTGEDIGSFTPWAMVQTTSQN